MYGFYLLSQTEGASWLQPKFVNKTILYLSPSSLLESQKHLNPRGLSTCRKEIVIQCNLSVNWVHAHTLSELQAPAESQFTLAQWFITFRQITLWIVYISAAVHDVQGIWKDLIEQHQLIVASSPQPKLLHCVVKNVAKYWTIQHLHDCCYPADTSQNLLAITLIHSITCVFL